VERFLHQLANVHQELCLFKQSKNCEPYFKISRSFLMAHFQRFYKENQSSFEIAKQFESLVFPVIEPEFIESVVLAFILLLSRIARELPSSAY